MITAAPAKLLDFARDHALGQRASVGVAVVVLLTALLTGQELLRVGGETGHRLRVLTVAVVPLGALLALIVGARFMQLA